MADNTINVTVDNEDVLEVAVIDNLVNVSLVEEQVAVSVDSIIEKIEETGGGFFYAIAETNISIHRVVALNSNGRLVYADNTDENTLDRVVGISLQSVSAGSQCKVIRMGDLTDQSFNFSGTTLYVGINGNIVTTPPVGTGYLQKVGKVVNSTTIYIDIAEPINII